MKRIFSFLISALLLIACFASPALAVEADPLPPVANAAAQMSDAALAQMEAAAQAGASSGEASSGEPSSEEPVLPLVPGEYESGDGAVLTVKEDGSCTYETEVSGVVNGSAMSGRLTFHGTLEDGAFSFTKVTFYGMDLTAIAASAGYTDGSLWEEEAAALYAAALAEAEQPSNK